MPKHLKKQPHLRLKKRNPSPKQKKKKNRKKSRFLKQHRMPKATPSPAAAKIMAEKNISASQINGTGPGGRITKGDVLNYLAKGFDASAVSGWGGTRETSRQKMSMLRKKVAERLVSVKMKPLCLLRLTKWT